MGLGCFFGHYWMSVEAFDGGSQCGKCCANGKCTHAFRVCMRCGKAEGFGSHGKLGIIPQQCRSQIASMRLGTTYLEDSNHA